ncbi:hypothetical protein BKE38_28080 [Pseudoroseomonas deserti]|uniref:Uncharacterized protein n=1 Tax=Teichococcus deserti TaxID=1817963 RepID=A0A1V2GUG9_9PROT|nr:hypothetical protein [Pseudoroseomonas deserti]ONG44591.1 hypothetical protein BKE38_28080 [Pseudoroseomonas deserti]
MITWTELGAVLALTLFATLGVAGILWRPLHDLLERIWQSPVPARFWTRFATLIMVSCAVFIVCLTLGRSGASVEMARHALGLIAFAILCGLFILGIVMADMARPRAPLPAARPGPEA